MSEAAHLVRAARASSELRSFEPEAAVSVWADRGHTFDYARPPLHPAAGGVASAVSSARAHRAGVERELDEISRRSVVV